MVRSVEGEWAVLGAVVYAGAGRTKDGMGVGGKEEEEEEKGRAEGIRSGDLEESGEGQARAAGGAGRVPRRLEHMHQTLTDGQSTDTRHQTALNTRCPCAQ